MLIYINVENINSQQKIFQNIILYYIKSYIFKKYTIDFLEGNFRKFQAYKKNFT